MGEIKRWRLDHSGLWVRAVQHSSMASDSPLINLPSELRCRIYEYVALDAGVDLSPQSGGKPTSSTPLSLLCCQLHDEYEDVLYTSTPVVSAYVRDFEFTHLIAFLDNLDLRLEHQKPMKSPSVQFRTLRIILILTPSSPSPARKNLDKLLHWLVRCSEQNKSHYIDNFKTTYSVHRDSIIDEKNAIAPVTLMRIIDEIHCNWLLKTISRKLKEEILKVCDCLGEVEREINRRRSVPQSVGFDDSDAAMEVDFDAGFG